jgi:folate-binding protein YgfZ
MSEASWFYEFRPRANFAVGDEDAAEFLQSQFSNELRPFEPGQATYGLWLDVKGKVLGDSVVLCRRASDFQLLSERSDGMRIREHLEHHIIADDVEISSVAGGPAFELSAAACSKLELSLPPAGRFIETEYGRLSHAPESHYIMLTDSDSQGEDFRERLSELGCPEIACAARHLLRISAGRPLLPDEIGSGDLPGEGELESLTISFTKGCYLGQEVVARMHNLGQAQRQLFVVEGKGSVPQLPLPLSNEDSKRVGEVRSAYPQGDGWQGVALLKRRFVGPGQQLCAANMEISVLQPLSQGAGR